MKIYTQDSLDKPLESRRVATVGFFDGVHLGHRFLLDFVRRIGVEGGLETMAVTFPDSPLRVLRPDAAVRLLTTGQEKCRLLEQCGIDVVVMLPFTQELAAMTAERFMQAVLRDRLGVDTLVMGYDHRFGRGAGDSFSDYVAFGEELGIRVVQAPEYHGDGNLEGVSSSAVRGWLAQGDVVKANRALGYEYFLEGEVASGHHVGTSLGFPTANISVPPLKLVPANGVYAVRAELDGWSGYGMLNIGQRPTLDNGKERSVEVHLFDFHGDIYAKRLRVSLVDFIRKEVRFDSLDALKKQLQTDESVCRSLFHL